MTSVMVVAELNLYRLPVFPLKAEPPLVVDADAETSCPFAPQLFQMIARRDAKVVEGMGGVEHLQLAEELPPYGCWYPRWSMAQGVGPKCFK